MVARALRGLHDGLPVPGLVGRFEGLQAAMDTRFDDARVHSDRRFASLQWTILVGLAVVTAAVTVFGLLA